MLRRGGSGRGERTFPISFSGKKEKKGRKGDESVLPFVRTENPNTSSFFKMEPKKTSREAGFFLAWTRGGNTRKKEEEHGFPRMCRKGKEKKEGGGKGIFLFKPGTGKRGGGGKEVAVLISEGGKGRGYSLCAERGGKKVGGRKLEKYVEGRRGGGKEREG